MLRNVMIMEAREGFRQNQFFLIFQPRICSKRKTIFGYQVLLRWRHPRNGLLSPSHFMAELEMSNIAAQITRFMLTEGIQRIHEWRARGLGEFALSIRLPAMEIMREGFISQVAHMLQWCDVEPGLLEIEITEDTDFSVIPTLASQMTRLQKHGIRIALGQFGTGFASLSMLQRLPFDAVRLDRSLMSGAPDDPTARAIVETFVTLCERLGRRAVIDGVERASQLDWLCTLPPLQAQGTAISPAIDAADVETLLTRFNRADVVS